MYRPGPAGRTSISRSSSSWSQGRAGSPAAALSPPAPIVLTPDRSDYGDRAARSGAAPAGNLRPAAIY
ncbi:hypothetical protein GCM10009546_37430 [Actinomadura livida]|uniref:Uncharacterized protein n=1 Tax=Actinomadura livida TaxID=79909 RepID=A0ABP3PSP0_9ACTN|nr:hypothetical protein GCM10010208_46760 [Actinomadura livida]